jgi:hypothetical protein
MTFTPEMRKTIEAVEATRLRRLNETLPSMSLDERSALLNTIHPDFVAE